MQVKLYGLPPPRGQASYRLALSTSDPSNSLVLSGLVDVRNLINQSLDVVDVSTWTGDAKDANFISGQLRLLFDNIQEARQTLKGSEIGSKTTDWTDNPVDPSVRCALPALTRLTPSSYSSRHCLHPSRFISQSPRLLCDCNCVRSSPSTRPRRR